MAHCLSIIVTPLGFYYNDRTNFGYSTVLPRSSPGPLPLYYPIVYFSFVGYSTRDKGLGSKDTPLLCSVIVPHQNKATLWS